MEGKLGIKNNSNDIRNFENKIIILLTVLLTLNILLPEFTILFIILFIIINIYSVVKSIIFLIPEDYLVYELFKYNGIDILGKHFYKYNFFTRYFFKKALNMCRVTILQNNEKIKDDTESLYKIIQEFSKNSRSNGYHYRDINYINNCLRIFGLNSNELNLKNVNEKYRNLAKQYHSDIIGNIDDIDKMKEINSCKERLVRFIKNKGF